MLSYAKFTFTCCLNWNVCWQCVYTTHPIMIKIHSFFFISRYMISPFSNLAVLRFLTVWRHMDSGPSHDCWLTWPSYLSPALSELSLGRHCVDTVCCSRRNMTQRLKVVPCYIITSYLAGDFFQALHHIIAPSALMVRQQSSLIITPEWEYSS